MKDFTIIEKFRILVDLIVSSPLFLSCSIAIIIMLALTLIFALYNKKVNKWIYIIIWLLALLLIIYFYRNIILSIIDNFFDNLFMALYFPNLSIYLFVILISNGVFAYSILGNKIKKSHKILNLVNAMLIDLLLLFIISTVRDNNINIYEKITVYSNSTLLVLLELSTAFFTSWILLNLLFSAYDKLKKYDKKLPSMPGVELNKEGNEIVFDEL